MSEDRSYKTCQRRASLMPVGWPRTSKTDSVFECGNVLVALQRDASRHISRSLRTERTSLPSISPPPLVPLVQQPSCSSNIGLPPHTVTDCCSCHPSTRAYRQRRLRQARLRKQKAYRSSDSFAVRYCGRAPQGRQTQSPRDWRGKHPMMSPTPAENNNKG